MHSNPLARRFSLICCLLSFCGVGHAALYENSGHTMTGGSFGLAYLHPQSGDVMLYQHGARPQTLLAGANATGVMAANIDGLGGDELVYVSGGGLYHYNFTTQTANGAYGSGIIDLSAASLDGGAMDTVMVATGTGGFQFNHTASNTFANTGGGFSRIAAGDINVSNSGGEFVVGNSGGFGYYFTPDPAFSFSQLATGSGIVEVAAGNLLHNDAEHESAVNNTSNMIFLHDRSAGFYASLGTGTNLAVGDLDGDLGDELYYLSGGSVWQSINGAAGSLLNVDNNFGWSQILLADLNGLPGDELYALRANQAEMLYRYDFGTSGFVQVVPEPTTSLLLGIGLLVGAWKLRRARRKV